MSHKLSGFAFALSQPTSLVVATPRCRDPLVGQQQQQQQHYNTICCLLSEEHERESDTPRGPAGLKFD